MHADLLWARRARLLLAMALLSTGCASLAPSPGQGMNLRYTPHEASGAALAERSIEELPHVLVSPPSALPAPDASERLLRRETSHEAMTGAGRIVGGAVLRDAAESTRPSAIANHLAFLGAIREVAGDMSIDHFCIKMEQSSHQAVHGGGNWHLGRKWPGEWNQMIMEALYEAEAEAGQMLTRSEVLRTVAFHMKRYNLPMSFTRWRGK